ncbi:MAG: ABC transporter permease [Saprospiraceae bacterium]|nr:ABC transporter permease [Saprospiraceae bacterium]
MLRHYLILAARKLQRNKTSFLINIIGLSTGLACALFIFLWVQDELNVDKFNENDDQLYQVLMNADMPGETQTWNNTPGPLGSTLVNELPEVVSSTAYHNSFMRPQGILMRGNEKLQVEGLYAKPNYFTVFSYPLLIGSKEEVLSGKSNIVLSREMAVKLFGSVDEALGKMVEWKNEYFDESFQVSGVYAHPPVSATNQFDVVISYQWLVDIDHYAEEWSGGYAATSLILQEGTDLAALSEKMTDVYYSKRPGIDHSFKLFVQKYSDNYLYGNFENGVQSGGRIDYVKLFSLIAIFIIIIACINFMNLSTAQSSHKMMEVGVRKTVGASRQSLIFQFLAESFIVTIAALIIALFLVSVFLPSFNVLTGKALALEFTVPLVVGILCIGFITGLLSGSYPEFLPGGI